MSQEKTLQGLYSKFTLHMYIKVMKFIAIKLSGVALIVGVLFKDFNFAKLVPVVHIASTWLKLTDMIIQCSLPPKWSYTGKKFVWASFQRLCSA